MPEFLVPLHPKMVHFPIALFMTALFFELLSLILKKELFHKTALSLYVFAALFTPLVVFSVLWEEHRLHLAHPLLTKHKTCGLWAMWTALVSLPVLWFFRKQFTQQSRALFFFVLLALAALVTFTGYYGGEMVYEYGVAVER